VCERFWIEVTAGAIVDNITRNKGYKRAEAQGEKLEHCGESVASQKIKSGRASQELVYRYFEPLLAVDPQPVPNAISV